MMRHIGEQHAAPALALDIEDRMARRVDRRDPSTSSPGVMKRIFSDSGTAIKGGRFGGHAL